MSRLDMIFASGGLSLMLRSSNLNWSFDDSDHSLLTSTFEIKTTLERGPGLVRVNTDLLDDDLALESVKSELESMLNQIPEGWDPHAKLDFIKMSIRSVFSVVAGKMKRIENFEQEAISEQINSLRNTKEKIEMGMVGNQTLLREVDRTLAELESEHKIFLDQKS